jgi:hypothetical protein
MIDKSILQDRFIIPHLWQFVTTHSLQQMPEHHIFTAILLDSAHKC